VTSFASDPRLEIAKLLLEQEDDVLTASVLLRRVMQMSGADRGYVVAKDGDQFRPVFAERFDVTSDDDSARFSRSLVRKALGDNRFLHSVNPGADPEFSELESVAAVLGRAVIVAPLSSGEDRFGALYLEHPRAGGFSSEALTLVADIAELAGLCLRNAMQRSAYAKRASSLEHDLFAKYDFQGIVTRDPGMLKLLQTLVQVANAKASALIVGESGTGKELLAKALHVNSERRTGPFVALHCAALPHAMLESELFGHVRGAFTGAEKERAGRLASAHGGTLFLDEVAEIPIETQAKLLRAVQFGELQRLGSDKVERVDVRIVSATHRDLSERVERGEFRQDLYYRLRVVELRVPPLRSRRGDIALLCDRFIQRFAKHRGVRLSARSHECLGAHAWPGNIRELENALERACLLAADHVIEPEVLPEEIASARPSGLEMAALAPADTRFSRFDKDELEAAVSAATRAVERAFIDGLLALHDDNVSRAASESGIHRSQLQKIVARVRRTEP
jgi:transcriptional regulator with GAF, ATPase, and Fis domain